VAVTATSGALSASAAFSVTAPATASVLFGVSTPSGPYNLAELDSFERNAGKKVGLLLYFQGWAYDDFNTSLVSSVAQRGAVPEITWEPWDYRAGLSQPDYALSTIVDGTHDAYIRRWAEGAKAYGGPLLVRFAHEMNDRYYPWSELVNGNQPGQYVAAWRHVVDVFRSVGATNVHWVWSPSVSYAGTVPLSAVYPGDGYVDWIAVDGYNGGTALPWGGWLTFDQVFGTTLNEVGTLTAAKPLMIGETSSAEAGGSKASWISDFFSQLAGRPGLKAFVWFDQDKETDWRIESSTSATQAFAAGVADARYGRVGV
jgi:beta-mannanase